MKKILIFLVLLFSVFSVITTDTFSACKYTDNADVGKAVDDCLKNSTLVNGKNLEIKAGGGFQQQIQTWIGNIALYLGIFAVGSIVLGGLMLVFSAGEEEKIKKAKGIVKWGMIGFLGVVFASAIISLLVRIIYSL